MKKFLLWGGGILATLILVSAIGLAKYFGMIMVEYDEIAPEIPADLGSPAVLVFSKAAGFVHVDALPAGKSLLDDLATRNGWGIFQTENGAVMSEELLARFDVVVWNNTSGTTLNEEQRAAFRDYLEGGGGFVGLHAAGGDPWYAWDWYVNELIGTQFIGHTMDPHFQDADLLLEAPEDPIVAHLPSPWRIPDEEWYGFDVGVRNKGFTVLLNLDEKSYDPNNSGMEGEHPNTWKKVVGEGRAFYTAIGHQGATYSIPEFRQMVENAVRWAGSLD